MSPVARILRASPATWIISAVIGGLYALQMAWGGPGSEPLLARMGALHGPSVLEGQLWRLASGSLLHLDPAHLATNLVMLVAVGRPVEMLLGTARWLVIFVGAILGGTIASLAFTPGLAVGASGGLTGLLAACAVLALTRGDALPGRLRMLVRSATLLALAITVLQSMQPGIDMAVHVGGGLTGVAIMFLPPMRPADLDAPPSEELRIGSVFAAIVLGLAPTLAIFAGGGWRVMEPPRLVPRVWSGLRLPMPDLPPRATAATEGGRTAQLFGGVEDTAVIGLAVDVGLDDAAARRALDDVAERWRHRAPADGFTPRDGGISVSEGRVIGRFDGPDGRWLEASLVALDGALVRVEVAPRRGHGAAWEGVAGRIASGVERSAPSTSPR